MMEQALAELKIQAKKRLKALKTEQIITKSETRLLNKITGKPTNELQLKHCQALIAMELGFTNWQHAQALLSGKVTTNLPLDFGTLFYPPNMGGLTNLWFADYQKAVDALAINPATSWLVPYKTQFIVVEIEYLKLLGVAQDLDAHWATIDHNLVAGYNTNAWDIIAYQVIKKRQLSR